MNQTQEFKPEFKLAGVSTRTTNAAELGPDGCLGKLWESYFQSNIASRVGSSHPEFIYALYTDYESDATGAFTVLIGHDVQSDPDQMGNHEEDSDLALACWSVPESQYFVFQTKKGPVFEVVAQAWGEIWAYFQTSKVERAYTGDFEVYDARNFDPNHAEVLIYIAVKQA